jgi:hypothetical protein
MMVGLSPNHGTLSNLTITVLEGIMTSLEKRVFRFIKFHPGCTAQDIRDNYVRSPRLEQVEEILESLVTKGFISSKQEDEQASAYQIVTKAIKKVGFKDIIVS